MTYITLSVNFLDNRANEINRFKKALKEYGIDEHLSFKNLWTISIENDNFDEVKELLTSTLRIAILEAKITKEIKILAQIGNREHIIF